MSPPTSTRPIETPPGIPSCLGEGFGFGFGDGGDGVVGGGVGGGSVGGSVVGGGGSVDVCAAASDPPVAATANAAVKPRRAQAASSPIPIVRTPFLTSEV